MLVLAIALSEVGVRVAKRYVCSGRGASLYAPHPELGWFHVPGSAAWQYACFDRSFEFRTWTEIDSRGLRDREWPAAEAAGERVLLLGDSITEAVQVRLEETFAERLEDRLRLGSRRVEVLNGAVAGYSTDNELLFYRHQGRRYDADIVLLAFNLQNDIAENHPDIFEAMYGRGLDLGLVKPAASVARDGSVSFDTAPVTRHIRGLEAEGTGWFEALRARVYVLRLFDRTLGRLTGRPSERRPSPFSVPPSFGIYDTGEDPVWLEAWRRTDAFVRALRDEVESHGSRFAVVLVPAKETIDDVPWTMMSTLAGRDGARWSRGRPHERALEMLAAARIDVIDLAAALDARREDALFFKLDVHLTATGHEVVTDALAAPVARLLELGRPATGPLRATF